MTKKSVLMVFQRCFSVFYPGLWFLSFIHAVHWRGSLGGFLVVLHRSAFSVSLKCCTSLVQFIVAGNFCNSSSCFIVAISQCVFHCSFVTIRWSMNWSFFRSSNPSFVSFLSEKNKAKSKPAVFYLSLMHAFTLKAMPIFCDSEAFKSENQTYFTFELMRNWHR